MNTRDLVKQEFENWNPPQCCTAENEILYFFT